MKKLLLFLALSLVAYTGTAQENSYNQQLDHRDLAKNELSLNAFNILIFGVLEGTYERVISDQSTISVDVFADVFNKKEGEDIDFSEVYTRDFAITTGFKFFFNEDKIARGFYAEGFGMLSGGETFESHETTGPGGEPDFTEVEVDYTDFALGLGLGGKFVARQGFLIDVSFGMGRNLFNNDSPVLVIQTAVNVGYRF